MYTTVRNIHLALASMSLPFLLMYGLSAVQMSHPAWFRTQPAVHERELLLPPGEIDARAIARRVMERERSVRGEVNSIQPNATGVALRIVIPGTVHEVRYDRESGATRLKTSTAGTIGMLNRLHHAAGLWHEPVSMKFWGAAVAIVSVVLLLIGATGIYMWFTGRAERRVGLVLVGANVLVAVVMLTLMRFAGP